VSPRYCGAVFIVGVKYGVSPDSALSVEQKAPIERKANWSKREVDRGWLEEVVVTGRGMSDQSV
jgi:hypothetical protein|tara:strand:+ start:339 stop:530 length:192 start_codon:yes stop_codon:yes gene_type:complete